MELIFGLVVIVIWRLVKRRNSFPLYGNRYQKRAVLNKTEREILRFLQKSFPDHLVLGAVALNQMVSSKGYPSSQSIDVTLCSWDTGLPLVAIEFNGGTPGTGHYQNDYLYRDEKKAYVLRSADIPRISLTRWNKRAAEQLVRDVVSVLVDSPRKCV